MRILATMIVLFAVMFVSDGPTASAQVPYPSPPVTAPPSVPGQQFACPVFGSQQTTPFFAPVILGFQIFYQQQGCRYWGGVAIEAVPGGFNASYRYADPTSPWNGWQFTAGSGTRIRTDAADFSPAYYSPGVPIYQPPYTPPVTQPPYTPPAPGLPAPGTPVPPRTPTGVGLTLGFAQGWPVVGWRLQYASGRTVYDCYTASAPEAGWVTDGVISPHQGELRPYCP